MKAMPQVDADAVAAGEVESEDVGNDDADAGD
jgi:hypothetical protein